MVRATMVLVIGFLVLLGWSTAAAAGDRPATDRATPAASKSKPKPLLGLGLEPVTGLLTPLTESVGTTLETATKPVVTTLAPTVRATTETVRPVVQTVREVAKPVVPVVAPVLKTVEPMVRPVLTPVVEHVVAPVVGQVVAPVVTPVVEHVVAPVVAPTLEPVTMPIIEELGETPTSAVTEPLENILAPIVDPLTPTAAPTENSIPSPSDDVHQSADANVAVLDASPATDLAGRETSGAASAFETDGPSGLAIAAPPSSAVANDHPAATAGPTSSSDLPVAPAPGLPDGAPCTTSPSSTGGPSVAATAPDVHVPGRSWRRMSSCSTTMVIPDGRPRPQPGFSPG